MIAVVDVAVQATNPSLPLFPMRAFEGSPSSIRIRNVPKRIGDWVIDKVYFAVTYPDNSTQTIECKLVGGVYVGTIVGCDTIGNVKNGYSIFADGKDENGNAITNYCLGKGDIQILDARGITQPLQNTTFVQILSAHPASPNDGDMWYENDAWYVWQNGQALPIGDDSAIIGNLSERVDELSAELSNKQDELTDAEKYALSDTVYDLATKFYFTDNTTSAFSWNKAEITLEDFIEAGLVDENGTWIKQPRIIEVGKPVIYFHANAFAGCTNLNSVVFYGAISVNFKRNYPWGISNTNIIQPFYNASQYWVEQKGYASTYPYQNVAILPFGTRVASLQPYKVNNLNFNSQAATFRVDVGGSAGKMRDMYFVFTVPSDSQPMTWNTYFDRFEGGDATSVAPTSGTNIYHIYEYTSGHFAVEKFNNTYTKSQVDSKLNNYELKANLTSDVSAIVTQTSPVAEFAFVFVSGNPVDTSLYRAVKMDASDEPRYNIYYGNTLAITGVLLADDMSYPLQVQDDLNGCIIDVTKTTEDRNAFGFASYDWVKNYIDQYMQEHQS